MHKISHTHTVSRRNLYLLLCLLLCALSQYSAARTVVLVSIDGLRPDYVTKADEHGLKIPNLRRIMKEGTYAEGVVGVVPTVTYPSHTTLITGVWPQKHGIYANTTFDPERKNREGWYWYSEDIKVPTLWDIASRARINTASVNWPVSVGAHVNYLIPEVWRAGTAEDQKLLRALATPGMLPAMEKELGPYSDGLGSEPEHDGIRTKFAVAILQQHKPGFMTVHLSSLDHAEHSHGPFSPEANAVLEKLDEQIGELRSAALAVDPQAVICIVSDHGFQPTSHRFNPTSAFVQAGLIETESSNSQPGGLAVKSWQAMPWNSGGLAAIILKNPNDAAVLQKTGELLKQLAADPANGIDRIVETEELKRLGGFPNASFLVNMKSGFQLDSALNGPLHNDAKPGGTHGYLPDNPELRSSFFIAGRGIDAARSLGVIDMRQIAPTLASLLGLSLPSADFKPIALNASATRSMRKQFVASRK